MIIETLNKHPLRIAVKIAKENNLSIGNIYGMIINEDYELSNVFSILVLTQEKKPSFWQKFITFYDTYDKEILVWFNNAARGDGFVIEVFGGDLEMSRAIELGLKIKQATEQEVKIVQKSYRNQAGFQPTSCIY